MAHKVTTGCQTDQDPAHLQSQEQREQPLKSAQHAVQHSGEAVRDQQQAKDLQGKAKGKGTAQETPGNPNTGVLAVDARPSDTGSHVSSMHGLQQVDHPHAYKVEDLEPVYIGGKRFLFTASIPVAKQPETPQEVAALEEAVREWRDAMIQKLEEEMPTDSPIRKARNFGIVCGHGQDDGVVVYTQEKQTGWNPELPIEDGISSGYFGNPLRMVDEAGKQLNRAISSCSPERIRQHMQAEALQRYTKPRAEKAAVVRSEVGLENIGNTCYLNSAFQQIATNEYLLNYLVDNPQLFDGGSPETRGRKNQFWIALNKYRENQGSENPEPLHLGNLLHALTTTGTFQIGREQSDAHEAYMALIGQLKIDRNSPLFAEIKTQLGAPNQQSPGGIQWGDSESSAAPMMVGHVSVNPQKDSPRTLQELLQAAEDLPPSHESVLLGTPCTKKRDRFLQAPKVLQIHVARYGAAGRENIPDKYLDALVCYLKGVVPELNFNALVGSEHAAQFRAIDPNEDSQGAYEARVQLGRLIVGSEPHFQALQGILTQAQKKVVASWIPTVKVETPVTCPLELTLPEHRLVGPSPRYHLMSFGCHIGQDGAGHYVTYFVRNGKYFCANDSHVEPVTKEEFEEKATKALPSTLVYNAEEHAKQATRTSEVSDSQEGASHDSDTHSLITLADTETHGVFKSTVQCAKTVSVFGQEVPLVNVTNSAVTKVHSAITDAHHSQFDRIGSAKAAKIAGRTLNMGRSKTEYSLGTGGVGRSPEVMVTPSEEQAPAVYHIGSGYPIDTSGIKRAVKEAIKQASKDQDKKIVFLVPDKTDPETTTLRPEAIVRASQEAVREYAHKHEGALHGVEVVTLLTREQAKECSAYKQKVEEAEAAESQPDIQGTQQEEPVVQSQPTQTVTPDPLTTLTPNRKIKITTVPKRDPGTDPENVGDRTKLVQDMAVFGSKQGTVTLDLCPGALPESQPAGLVHIDPRKYTGCSVETAVAEFADMLAPYVHGSAHDGREVEINVVVPVGTDTAALQAKIDQIAALKVPTTGIAPTTPSGTIQWVDQYKGTPVVVEKANEIRRSSGNVMVTKPDSPKEAFKARIQEHISSIQDTTCVLDLRRGAKTSQDVCPFTISEFYDTSIEAWRDLKTIFEEGIDTHGKTVQVILPSDFNTTVQELTEFSNALRPHDLPSHTATPVTSSQPRPIGDKPSREQTLEWIKQPKDGEAPVEQTPQTYLQTACESSMSKFTHPMLPQVTIIRTNTRKTDHDKSKSGEHPTPDWSTIVKGTVVDCRPGVAPEGLPVGVHCVDGRDFASLEDLAKDFAQVRESEKRLESEITLIIPEKDWGEGFLEEVQIPSDQPVPEEYSKWTLYRWGQKTYRAVGSLTSSAREAQGSKIERIRFSKDLKPIATQ